MKKLGDIGKIITGNTPKTSDHKNYETRSICFVKPSDIAEDKITRILCSEFYISEYAREKARIVPPESVLVTCIGSIGKVAISGIECAINQQINAIIPDSSKCNAEYLAYLLQYKKSELQLMANAPVVPILNKSQFSELSIELPSLDEQKIVNQRLNKITNIISLRQQQLAKLDELVKARFVEMFGDVIHNDKKWKEYRFSDITSSRLGKMLDAKQQTGKHSFPYLANANVQWFRFETDNLNRMDFNEAEQVEFSLKDGDLLVCEGGEIGRCAVWHNQVQSCYFQKALHRVRCNQEIILPDYLAWWFKFNCENNGFAAIEGAKATIAHLPGAKLKQLLVVVPPIERQYRFVDFIEQTDVVKVTVQKSLEQMGTLKKALMQQYFG